MAKCNTHKLSLLKLIFPTKHAFARRFEEVAVEQIFSNFKQQCKTRQMFQPLALNDFLALKFCAQAIFKLFENPPPGFENLNFSNFLAYSTL